MLRILDRYIFREIALSWLAVTGVLLFILLTNQFARVLGEVAKDSLPKNAIFQIIGLTALQYMTVLVPIGLFLAIMLALGRLYRDSELPAMMACRVGPGDIYRPLSWLMLPLVFGVGWLAMDTAPKALSAIERINLEARRQADIASIEPGRFAVDNSQGAVIYAETVIGPGVIENVFMERQLDEGIVEVIVAKRGEQRNSDDPNTRYFILFDGRRYEGIPGTSRFRVMEFAEHGIPYRLPGVEEKIPEPRAMRTFDLMTSSNPEEIAEWHFRLGVPLATLILAILAVPLSKSQPRQGRYARLAIGLLVFIIYFNLMSAGKAWLEQGTVSPAIGIWWVHALMLAIAVGMLSIQNGLHRRIFAVGRRK
ncbi:MAG: LPS export ABC transporter permease LptF [Gammaproteobacteria bacterium]|nr:LPS export ABC transporter permease LptF [Gammaproteobacteria bacterium]MDH4314942.1 LPS export ABC transporter permease LptF [Gammaproteobacteria bacterium]MDH5214177.1 LPS export ABC transporter permease LptF [Gammaproteobacteria bacterium]MDH5501618.1 LPS export ABC transporter permease LptF [Gammaproteobacteria bacterium]